MPMYDYQCKKCGFKDEYLTTTSELCKPPKKCPKCNGKFERLLSLDGQSFDVIGGSSYHNGGKRDWKKDPIHAARALAGEVSPY